MAVTGASCSRLGARHRAPVAATGILGRGRLWCNPAPASLAPVPSGPVAARDGASRRKNAGGPAQGGGIVHATARVAALAALIAACVPAPALAGASSGSMKVWAATSYIAPLSESDRNVGGVTAAVTGSNAMGYEFGVEFRKGSMGFAFDYLHSRQELQHATAGFLGSADFNPISAALMLHLPTPVLDLAAGVTASYVNWGD